jgi:Ser/Thr protein kinase RdoA (MazF antagonist)
MDPLAEIKKIAPHFQIPGECVHAEPFGHGHINDTYLAGFNQLDGSRQEYIFQRVNQYVFKDPAAVNGNILAVTAHLRKKITAAGGDPARGALILIPTRDGGTLYTTSDGTYWRVFNYIQNAHTYQIPSSQAHVTQAGKAFGDFQRLLADFPTETLHETIIDFHNTPVRYQAFLAAIQADPHQCVAGVAAEIDFVRQRESEMAVIMDALALGKIPLRVTHNDTKFNNVMIDDHTGEAVCIVDLDTVMPGSLLFDFGDAIRSICNTAEEDEPDLDIVHFDLETFENFTKGYLSALGRLITSHEYALLPFSARLMTLECGMRFLTDHLEGDRYFRTNRQGHNLDRCRTQFKLVAEMEENYSEMKRIVSQHAQPGNQTSIQFMG